MSKILEIFFNAKLVGQLTQDKHGEVTFTYASTWLDDSYAMAISSSLPLRKETFTRKECRAFFAGILPEDTQRKLIAKNLGISANNDFSMLEKIGGECAGALTFISPNEKNLAETDDYHELTDSELANILRELPYRPLLAGEKGVRLSLAGVQDKIAVYEKEGKILIPLNGAPSTHILKPAEVRYPGLIINESYCLALANKIGLSAVETEIRRVEDIEYLLIKRYDRVITNDHIQRIHQEDFCQALGVVPENKYQSEGGPSLKRCFNLVREKSSIPIIDLERLIEVVIFNVLIGNCDAHGKNFSFIYPAKDDVQLTPFYDLISTTYYPDLVKTMAMKVGGESNLERVGMNDFEKMADEVGLSKAAIRKRVNDLIDKVVLAVGELKRNNDVESKLSQLITERCEKIRD